MFLFKKIVSQFFSPLSICIEILLIGLFFLWFTRRQKLGRLIVSVGFILLIALSYGFGSNTLLRSLECKYPPVEFSHISNDIKWVVVLGGGHISDPRLSANNQLSGITLARVIEGIRIHRLIPESKLILSGGSPFGKVPNAKVMADAAMMMGVEQKDIVLETESKDTKDEARLIHEMIDNDRFVLVTSASHMPRSIALFQKLGMNPIAAPTDYGIKEGEGGISPGKFFPNAGNIEKAERVVHEYLGMAWASIRGQI